MASLPLNEAVPGAAQRLRGSLQVRGLGDAVTAYFQPEEGFAGLSFTCLGSNPRDAVMPDDLLAVSLLDIAWRPETVRQLLDIRAATVAGLLAAIRSDLDLWKASDDDLAAVDPLWDLLLRMPGDVTTSASRRRNWLNGKDGVRLIGSSCVGRTISQVRMRNSRSCGADRSYLCEDGLPMPLSASRPKFSATIAISALNEES